MDKTFHFTVYAGYHQFYLSRDEESLLGSGEDSFWTGESIRRLLAAGRGLVGVGTMTFGHVPVSLEISSVAPKEETSGWDHVAEASLDLLTGWLHLTGCPDGSAGSLPVTPGIYRVRVYSGRLDTAGDEIGHDHYRIVLWPAPPAPPRVLKQWSPALRFSSMDEDTPPLDQSRALFSH